MNKLKILFISHSARQTGAPGILLELMRWLRREAEVEMDLLVRDDGTLTEEFEKLAKVYKVGDRQPVLLGRWLHRYGQRLLAFHQDLFANLRTKRALQKNHYDIIYCNSIYSLPLLSYYVENVSPGKLLLHIHEHKFMFEAAATDEIKLLTAAAAKIIVPSEATRNVILARQEIQTERVEVVSGFIDIAAKDSATGDPAALRHKLGIPDDAIIIGATGNDDWIKGADFFMELAARMTTKTSRQLKFIWVGGEDLYVRRRQFEIDKRGLSECFINLSHVPNPMPYFKLFDILVLPSREESFSLVNLEAGLGETPVICFQGAGGSDEFISQGGGITIPYPDVASLEQAALKLVEDDDLRHDSGRQLRERVINGYDVKHQAPKIFEIIKKICNND